MTAASVYPPSSTENDISTSCSTAGFFNRARQTFVRLNNKLMILLFGLLYKMARSRLIFTVLFSALTDVPQLQKQQVIPSTPNGTLQLVGKLVFKS